MLTVTDIYGNTEMLTGYKGLKRFRSVSGEKTLAFLILPTDQNAHSFDMVQEESVVEFDGDTYRIKQMNEKNKGITYLKEVVAIHTFFDLIDEYVYEKFTGSKTFDAFLQFVFAGTGYTWDILDTFYAQDWENLGDNNPLALFQDGLKRYGAEFTLNGTHLTFKQKIGNSTDFQFRYSYNIKTINRSVNTNNLSTYIKGFGKKNEDGTYLIQSEYTSPNSTIFGIRHAKPINDERYTTLAGLYDALIAELKGTPEISITLDFVDLRRAGFPYDVPNEGDDVFLIYEPMNMDLETRIMDITEEFTEFNDYPIKTDVTLANYRSNMEDEFLGFTRTGKTVDGIMNGSKKIPYSALDDAVKRATEALQSAQTELEFTNGIIARDKTNPNHLVLFNSAGIGVSLDGGFTFRTAMTAEGFVADLITAGSLSADRISGGTITGQTITSLNPTTGDSVVITSQMITQQKTPFTDFLGVTTENFCNLDAGYYTTSEVRTTVATGAKAGDMAWLQPAGLNFSVPAGATPFTSTIQIIASNRDLDVYCGSGKHIRLDLGGFNRGLLIDQENSATRLKIGLSGLLRGVDGASELEFRTYNDANWGTVKGIFSSQSAREYKKNIELETQSYLGNIESTPVYRYQYLEDNDNEFKRLGLIVDESPAEIVNPLGSSIELYAMSSYLWKGVQELSAKVKALELAIQS